MELTKKVCTLCKQRFYTNTITPSYLCPTCISDTGSITEEDEIRHFRIKKDGTGYDPIGIEEGEKRAKEEHEKTKDIYNTTKE